MNVDTELDTWRQAWQTQKPVADDLLRKVERDTRTMRLGVVAEVAVTVIFGAGSLGWALVSRNSDDVVFAVAVWIFIAVCWATSIALRRNAWRPATTTTGAFLNLSILRCRRGLHANVLVALLYVLWLTFVLAWVYRSTAARMPDGLWGFLTQRSVAFVWGVTIALAVLGAWHRSKLGRELQSLLNLRRQWDDSSDG